MLLPRQQPTQLNLLNPTSTAYTNLRKKIRHDAKSANLEKMQYDLYDQKFIIIF